ncbi:MAG: thioredoxin domain-containing protein [Gammaproteobacteria bacterium]|nr:MAG: thioredoxin domain-containing protein [Gammaproteobacteria bacterium]
MGLIPVMFRVFVVSLVMGVAGSASAAPVLQNQMVDHPSPYLAMHGDDPVHWQVWSRETLEKARTLNRPLLVSIGYFSCHWCHVMQRESYRDPALAKVLNEYFIPVKVDRELNPALDAHLIEFVQLTRGNAGWPLNVFLTPEGYPIVGMTYVPKEQFLAILDNLRQSWSSDADHLRDMAREGVAEWQRIRKGEPAKKPAGISAAHTMRVQTAQIRDELAGGFGQQTKFPMVSQLRALLWMREQLDDRSQDDFIRLTLDRMASQGMHDELGGGFFRYVTDPGWQVPHYEKMLYDNAQLAVLYLQSAKLFQSSRYRQIGLGTLDFMLREMWRDGGYFIASFSAVDEQGREGFYYLWDDATLEKLLNKEQLKAVKAAWFDEQDRHSEYGRLPRWQDDPSVVARQLGWSETRLEQVLASAREKLLMVRAGRTLLPDDKGLAAWNGLALSALAAGYAATEGEQYGKQADQLADYITGKLWDGKALIRARDGNQVMAQGTLEDYALVAQGLWDWSRQQPARKDYRELVGKLLRTAWQRYFKNGRWIQSDTPLIPMLGGRVALDDSPLPSATATIARLSQLHEGLRKDADIQKKVNAHLNEFRIYHGDSVFWYASYLELLEPAQPVE